MPCLIRWAGLGGQWWVWCSQMRRRGGAGQSAACRWLIQPPPPPLLPQVLDLRYCKLAGANLSTITLSGAPGCWVGVWQQCAQLDARKQRLHAVPAHPHHTSPTPPAALPPCPLQARCWWTPTCRALTCGRWCSARRTPWAPTSRVRASWWLCRGAAVVHRGRLEIRGETVRGGAGLPAPRSCWRRHQCLPEALPACCYPPPPPLQAPT